MFRFYLRWRIKASKAKMSRLDILVPIVPTEHFF